MGVQRHPTAAFHPGRRARRSDLSSLKPAKSDSPLFSVGTFLLTPTGEASQPQMAQISADVFMVSTPLSAGRPRRSAARSPKQLGVHIARGALSLPEGAKRVSRAAARLCERPRSPIERTQAPAGPEETRHAHSGTVSRPYQGRRSFFDRPVAALAGLACRPPIYRRAHRGRQAGPVFPGKVPAHLTDLGCWSSK